MPSARIEQMLGEISQLSLQEKAELLHALPLVLHGAAGSSQLSMAPVQQALATLKRIRCRLAVADQSAQDTVSA
jgi:hypothetical protein